MIAEKNLTGPLIKFCGMMRPEDAAYASELGASYVGAIFAESPRRVTPAIASAIYRAAGSSVRSVAVFGAAFAKDIAQQALDAGADVVQLHATTTREDVEALRRVFVGEIWAFVPLDPSSGRLPENAADLAAVADAMLFDSIVRGRAGGTGVTLDWARVAEEIAGIRSRAKVVLAGGLNPANVADAVRVLSPDVVDVSSGVESAPGIKDHRLMVAFAEAVRSASIDRGGLPSTSRLETK